MKLIRKILALVLWVSFFSGAKSGPTRDTEFIVAYDRNCHDKRSVLTALQATHAFTPEEFKEVRAHFSETVSEVSSDRHATTGVDPPTHRSDHHNRRLSDLDWEQRRDSFVSALQLFAKAKHNGTSKIATLSSARTSVALDHFDEVAMDVIDDTVLPHHAMFHFASRLPCLKFPPARPMTYYSTLPHESNSTSRKFLEKRLLRGSEHLPNDYDAKMSWHQNPTAGSGVSEAWKCYNGQKDAPVVAVWYEYDSA